MSVTRTTSQPPHGYVSGDNAAQIKLNSNPAAVQACPLQWEREYYISSIMREKGVSREVATAEHDFFN